MNQPGSSSSALLWQKLTCKFRLRFHLVHLVSETISSYKSAINSDTKMRFVVARCLDIFAGSMFAVWMAAQDQDVPLEEDITNAMTGWAEWSIVLMRSWLQHLVEVPFGLKLHSPLGSFLARFTSFLLDIWMANLHQFHGVLLDLTWAILYKMGFGGMSVLLAAASDLATITTLYLYCFYSYTKALLSLLSTATAMLYRLFRGKKYNPMRKRVDTLEFSTDQELIGTIFFAICIFLYPTMAAFHLVFATSYAVQKIFNVICGLIIVTWQCILDAMACKCLPVTPSDWHNTKMYVEYEVGQALGNDVNLPRLVDQKASIADYFKAAWERSDRLGFGLDMD